MINYSTDKLLDQFVQSAIDKDGNEDLYGYAANLMQMYERKYNGILGIISDNQHNKDAA
jgi:hypothetical protein